MAALEKPAVPAVLRMLLVFGQVALVAWLLALELAVWLTVLVVVARERHLAFALTGLLVAPLRCVAMAVDIAGMFGFIRERWHAHGQQRRRR